MARKLIALAFVTLLASPAAGDEGEAIEEDIDHVALAARLIRDGHYDRAAAVLRQVDEAAEDVDGERLNVLRGLVALRQKSYAEAARSFERATTYPGNVDPLIYINLGRARFGMKDYRGAVNALQDAGAAAEADPDAAMLESRAYWEVGNPSAAIEVLSRARSRFPERIELARLEILYLLELGLFQELGRRRDRLVQRPDVRAEDLAAIGEALRRGGRLEEAELALEAARLRFPDQVALIVQHSRVLMDAGKALSAAMLLEQAARIEPEYRIEAAELYRRAGRLERALLINQQVSDQRAKMRQRLQILLELQRFEMIAAMEARLSRLGLLADEQIRYALAYGFFHVRDFASAERHLRAIEDPALFEKSVALREAMERCAGRGWLCH